MVRSTDRPDMTLDAYQGRKTTTQHAMLRHISNDIYLQTKILSTETSDSLKQIFFLNSFCLVM